MNRQRWVFAFLGLATASGCGSAKAGSEHLAAASGTDLEQLAEMSRKIEAAVAGAGAGPEQDAGMSYELFGKLGASALPICVEAAKATSLLQKRLKDDPYEYKATPVKADASGLAVALDSFMWRTKTHGINCSQASLMQVAPCVADCRHGLDLIGMQAQNVALDARQAGLPELRLGEFGKNAERAASAP
jgi:hypothetical protein